MAKSTSVENQTLEKLDQILKVLALQIVIEQESISEGVRLLTIAGIDNKTIAHVLNTTEGTVRAISSNLKKRR